MGLLAPLYALAALAIAAPILFHLIRRQPRGQSEFSSLMFLQASPPRLTRRSRIDNLMLLLLRALALGLIAIAFARPFMRSAELADAQVATREILLLVDTSGSMQRADVWKGAIESAQQYLRGLGDTDLLGLATFDTKLQLRIALPSSEESGSTPSAQQSAVLSELEQLQPSYRGTRLADCLIAAVDILQERSTAVGGSDRQRELVLISDLHESSGIEALQGFAWPENVRLDIRRVIPAKPGNARATLMETELATSDSSTAQAEDNSVRVRIENNHSSDQVDFQLQWMDAATVAPVRVQVPAGQARVVPVPLPPGKTAALMLTGDNADFDNRLDVPRTAPRQERIAFVGQPRASKEEDLFFFLSQIPFDTPVRDVTVQRLEAEQIQLAIGDESLAGLTVEAPLTPALSDQILKYVQSGRPAVVVLARALASDDPSSASALEETEKSVQKLLNLEAAVSISEAEEDKFALWTDIDFRHPLFLPLSDARFNDFGKVRFWSHRQLQLPVDGQTQTQTQAQDTTTSAVPMQDYRVLARFDDSTPALIHRRVGTGDLWLLMAGWQTTSSQLALSSKFVPLMFGMFDLQGRSIVVDAVYEVGETIPTAALAQLSLTTLEGSPIEVEDESKLTLEQPGLYWLVEDGKRRQIAVTLPISESQLDPLDQERFLQYGVLTGESSSADELKASARLSQVHELEGRQKLWRWVLVAALAVLILETLVAWRTSLA